GAYLLGLGGATAERALLVVRPVRPPRTARFATSSGVVSSRAPASSASRSSTALALSRSPKLFRRRALARRAAIGSSRSGRSTGVTGDFSRLVWGGGAGEGAEARSWSCR